MDGTKWWLAHSGKATAAAQGIVDVLRRRRRMPWQALGGGGGGRKDKETRSTRPARGIAASLPSLLSCRTLVPTAARASSIEPPSEFGAVPARPLGLSHFAGKRLEREEEKRAKFQPFLLLPHRLLFSLLLVFHREEEFI